MLIGGVRIAHPIGLGIIEDLPRAQCAVAAKVQLSRPDPAARHPDVVQCLAAVDLLFPSLEQRANPGRVEFLIGRHQVFASKIFRREPARHDRPLPTNQRSHDPHAGDLEELPPWHRSPGRVSSTVAIPARGRAVALQFA